MNSRSCYKYSIGLRSAHAKLLCLFTLFLLSQVKEKNTVYYFTYCNAIVAIFIFLQVLPKIFCHELFEITSLSGLQYIFLAFFFLDKPIKKS